MKNTNYNHSHTSAYFLKNSFFSKLEHTDDDENQFKSAPIDNMFSTMNKSADLQRLTTSVETMRTSILQA